MPSYLISGLHVPSELELPGAIPEPSQATATDISIRRGPVPTALDDATASGSAWAKIGQQPEMFAHAAAMLGHAKMFLLIAPRGFEHMQETIAELRAHWDSLDR